jgi:uncharacterized membrane protein
MGRSAYSSPFAPRSAAVSRYRYLGMSSYELLLFLHITVVILWLGASVVLDLLFLRAERMHDVQELGALGRTQEWLTPRLFIPVSLGTVVTGALLVWDGPWSFGDLWVLIGLVAWLATFGAGFFFLRPSAERMKALNAQHGPGSPEARKIATRMTVVARVQLVALFLVVADMVIKPTSDDPWTLVVLVALLAAAIVAAAMSLRRRDAMVAAPEPE